MKTRQVTIHTLKQMKSRGERITALTAYDATFARLLDESRVEVLLVGDSLGMVIQGQETTLPVTLEDIIYHTRAVVRGASRAHVVADMPFMSYQTSLGDALSNAGRLVKEGGAHSVKLEGGAQHAELVSRLVECGIPVMGHVGLTPQSFHQMGGFKVQGRKAGQAQQLIDDAQCLENAGAYALVLEGIPHEIATEITQTLSIPTIGIGAGAGCDGQILVVYDLLGMNDSFKPKFVRRYEHLATRIRTAVDAFVEDVRHGTFPEEQESFYLDPKTQPQRASATVSAMAHVGACGPDPSSSSANGNDADSDDEDASPYSSPTKSE